MSAPLLGDTAPARKSASHGESGYVRAARDFYPTEPWVTKALLGAVEFAPPGIARPSAVVWEPAVGDGRMAAELRRAGYAVVASDIHDYGWPGTILVDFRYATLHVPGPLLCAIVTNPPFDLAKDFIRKALDLTEPGAGKVAILQRHEFDAPRGNRALFAAPFAAKLILPRRPRWSNDDKASPRFPYAWYLWDWRQQGEPVIRWLDDPGDDPRPERLL